MVYFVVCWANPVQDWDQDHCNFYFCYEDALAYAKRMAGADFECHIYKGKKLDDRWQVGEQTK